MTLKSKLLKSHHIIRTTPEHHIIRTTPEPKSITPAVQAIGRIGTRTLVPLAFVSTLPRDMIKTFQSNIHKLFMRFCAEKNTNQIFRSLVRQPTTSIVLCFNFEIWT